MASTASTGRDLVLAILHKRNFDSVAPFVLSLKRTGFSGRVVMFTSQVGAGTEDRLRENGVMVVPFHFSGKRDRQPLARLWPLWRWYFATGASPAAKIRLAHRVFHLRYRRYLLYDEFLQRHGADYDRILLADCTDVFFQADPFAWDWSPGVHFFMEEAAKRLGDCNLHRLWLGCQFGLEYVERHAQKNVSCSGTTFGDTASIRKYLKQMVATMMRARNLAKISGGDQGIHNYLLIEKLLDNLTVHPNREGPVMTMGVMRAGDWRMDDHGRVLNDKREVPPVLHQYDRQAELKKNLLARLLELSPASPS